VDLLRHVVYILMRIDPFAMRAVEYLTRSLPVLYRSRFQFSHVVALNDGHFVIILGHSGGLIYEEDLSDLM
jgi:hypothetical protein